jgi:hypothetical protein
MLTRGRTSCRLVALCLVAVACSVESASSDGTQSAGGADAAAPDAGAGPLGDHDASPAACPSYLDDFVPLVVDPVCSGCHGKTAGLPDWADYSVALGKCELIGQYVSTEQMPPPGSGFSLSDEQTEVVVGWTDVGCPEDAREASALCR